MNKQDHFLQTDDILLRVKKVEDLFYQSVIPLSCKRLLHPDVEELHSNSDFHITIQILEEHSMNTEEISSRVHKHFESKREEANYEIKKIFRLGWGSLFIGFVFLVIRAN